ncbi:MAG: DUF6152 family protein [Gammaproteobacteria bacterium]
MTRNKNPDTNPMTRLLLSLIVLVAMPMALDAHHSQAEYDRGSIIEFEAELVDVRWRNPHVMITVRAADDDGQMHDWELESSAVYGLQRTGLDGSAMPGFGPVTVAGWPSTTRPHAMRVTNLLRPDGVELVFPGAAPNRWASDVIGGRLVDERVERAELGFFRIWSVPDPGRYSATLDQSEILMTPAAQAEYDSGLEFDPCEPQGMPSIMQNPLPVQFADNGDSIELRMRTNGVVRTIRLDETANAADVAASEYGHSVGRLDGNLLEVRTTRINWPYFDDNAIPQSENVEVLETFSLTENGTRLAYSQTVNDPVSFQRPIRTSWDWVDINESELGITQCEQ